MIKYAKHLKFIGELLKYRITKIAHPILATICITNKCNLNCVYCYRDQSNKREFTTVELLDLIDILVEKGTRYISLNGGEPLLREDLDIIVDKIQQKNILCHLSTNGLLVRENINILKRVDSIALSLDGFASDNDRNRGEGSFEKIIDAIECLKTNKIKFYVHTVLTKNNKNAIDQMMTLAKGFNFKVQFSMLRTNYANKEFVLSDEEMKKSIVKIIEYKEKKYPVFFSKETYVYMLKQLNHCIKPLQIITCFLNRLACHIESDGKVYPCIELVGKFKALSIFDVGIEKALENLRNKKCKSCFNACCTDLNYLFSLKPNIILNSIKNVF
jgi:MoaA/NifB/PqqE/SkfB family radical SAM enzyme